MKRRNIVGRGLSLTLAFIGLMGWVGGADHASSRPTPPGSAASGQQPTSGGVNVWNRLGPDEQIRSLAVDPSNPNILYAGSKSGVFKSTDSGATWSNILVRNTRSLAIDFVNPNILYAGTVSSGIVFAPGDPLLFKSTDGGGASWSNSSSPLDFDFSLLVMDPSSPKTLYAGSEGRYVSEGGIVLWKSTDGGSTWNDRRTGNLGLASYGWAINPANPQTIYAPGELYTGGNVTQSSLFKSMDGGDNWSATGLHTFVSAVAIDPSNPETLYAGTTDYGFELGYTAFLGVFKSTNGGQSWFAINNGLTDLIYRSSTIAAIAIDPVDPNILYAGTSGRGVFRSADAGASWSEFNSGLTNLGVNALAIDPIERHLYAATAAGVFAYLNSAPCADLLSPADQAFDSSGGIGVVTFTAGSECSWTAASYANWIGVTSDSNGSGNGTVSYSVAPNESTATRVGLIGVAGRFLTVSQTGVPLRINNATVSGKKLFVFGENFDAGAVILLNGGEQNTKNDPQNPQTALIGKKAGKNLKPGDKLQVRNPNGTLSQEFIFTGS